MKKLISMVLVVLMVLPLIPAHAAYEPHFEYEAQMLYDFGLFKGTEKGFELDKKCDRLEAAAFFVRLLGKENEAINNPKAHPFNDVPEWASPYVGQMYADRYTKGISATEYGVGDITANQFATFCLRVLGYGEFKGGIWKFSYENALDKMFERFIIRDKTYNIIKSSDVFFRDHAVKLAYNTLFDQTNETERRFLIRKLIESGVVNEELVESRDIFVEEGIRYTYSVESFTPYFEKMIIEATSENKIVTIVNKKENFIELTTLSPASLLTQELLYRTAGGGLIQHRDVMADTLTVDWYEGNSLYNRTTIDPTTTLYAMTYRCIRYITHGDVELTEKEENVIDMTKEFLSTITGDMSDYDKYKAAYDYVAKNLMYSIEKTKSGDIDVLVDGYAVCQGYSTAYLYLCRLMGLECWSVGGFADKNDLFTGHAWNKVKLDGKYYNVDPTWNTQDYKYFLFKDLPERIVDEGEKIFDFPCNDDYKH